MQRTSWTIPIQMVSHLPSEITMRSIVAILLWRHIFNQLHNSITKKNFRIDIPSYELTTPMASHVQPVSTDSCSSWVWNIFFSIPSRYKIHKSNYFSLYFVEFTNSHWRTTIRIEQTRFEKSNYPPKRCSSTLMAGSRGTCIRCFICCCFI